MEDYEKKIEEVISNVDNRGEFLRKGQYIFNELYERFPKEVGEIWGTDSDCFYEDSNIDAFIAKVKEKVKDIFVD